MDEPKKMNIEKRVEQINHMISMFASTKRHIFKKKDNVAKMIFRNNRIYFRDDWTQVDILVRNGKEWNNFSHGGTTKAMVLEFKHFIRTGESPNGMYGYSGITGDYLGITEEEQSSIIAYAKEIGYLS